MVNDVDGASPLTSIVWCCDGIEFSVLFSEDPHADSKSRGKCNDFHVVTIRTPLSHYL